MRLEDGRLTPIENLKPGDRIASIQVPGLEVDVPYRAQYNWLSHHGLHGATPVAARVAIVRIPPDYFARVQRPAGRRADRRRLTRVTLLIAKNALGYVFIAAGLTMLVLPGQGPLTLLIGFLMVDFPGRYRLKKWVVSRPRVLKAVN